MAKDYYSILGVPRTASEVDIKNAFRRLAHEHHPDKGGSEPKFKEINEAYQVLGNKDRRHQYDQFGTAFDQRAGASGFAWQDINQGSPFGGFGDFGTAQQFDFGDLGDVLGDMFGFGTARTARGRRAVQGNDVETTLSLSFDESYFGTEKELNLSLQIACDVCRGSGNDPSAKISTCSQCRGTGTMTATRTSFIGSIRTQIACAHCNGTGKRADKKCTGCGGATVRNKRVSLHVKIPAGIDDSRTIRLTGKGEAGLFGGPAGDLYVRVRVGEHPLFTRDGYHIKSKEEVPLSILIAGGTIAAATPTGPVKLKIPGHTKSGTSFILRNKGFEKLTGRGRGDQYVTVHVAVPTKLTSNQRKLLADFEASFSE